MKFYDISLSMNLKIFSNGQEVIENLDSQLQELELKENENQKTVQPVSLLLLDINMPILNGLDTVVLVK